MKKLTILVDMDDTIENLMKAWISYLNKRHGLSVDPEEVVDWEVWKAFPGLTKEEVYHPLIEDEFWPHVERKDGALEYLIKLQNDGHKIYIVTASDYRTIKSKMDNVLFRYFPMFSWRDVIITCNKQLIKGDVLVDDGVHNLIGGDYMKILMDAPHNRYFDAEANDMCRAHTWEEVYDLINKKAKAD